MLPVSPVSVETSRRIGPAAGTGSVTAHERASALPQGLGPSGP
jgi:hypothetical protein